MAAPIASLSHCLSSVLFSLMKRLSLTVLIVTKLEHELVAGLSIVLQSEAALFDAIGEGKIR